MSSQTYLGESSSATRPIGPLAAVVLPGGVLALLSTTVVGVTVDDLRAAFPGQSESVPWVATIALLASGIAIPLTGWTSTRFGLRATWITAVAIFTIGSTAAAIAPNLPTLIAARAVQGFGGGALEPVMLSALARAAGPARMGRVMGATGAAMSLGPLLGPLGGGVIVQTWGWRWVFVTMALAAAVLLVTSIAVIRDVDRGPALLDLPGLLLLAAGSTLLLAGLARTATESGLDGPALGELAAGALALAALIRRALRRGPRAIVDLSVFRAAGFAPGILVMALLGAAIYPLLFGLPQFYESAAGLSPVVAGLLLVPYAIGQLAAMPATGWLSDRIGPRSLVMGGAAFSALTTGALTVAGVGISPWWFAVLAFALGLGTGSIAGPTVAATYRSLAPERVAAGSTILFLTNQLGGALGIALLSGIIRLGDDAGAWSPAVGTTPLLLPTAAAFAIAVVAARLPGRRRRE
jgi:EmrB/QacA subfamily drug resistance transporter